jgi:hypothetical protein
MLVHRMNPRKSLSEIIADLDSKQELNGVWVGTLFGQTYPTSALCSDGVSFHCLYAKVVPGMYNVMVLEN